MFDSYETLYVGLKVRDADGVLGTIMAIDDIHNVWVEFTQGGAGYYCMDPACVAYDQLRGIAYPSIEYFTK
jgi:transglutaminase-like putative cysteine protease